MEKAKFIDLVSEINNYCIVTTVVEFIKVRTKYFLHSED